MMNHDLIERYVYAVTRHLPSKMRSDVEAELKSLISDMLDDRCGDVMPNDKDIKVVLTELGTPLELAGKYSPDNDKALISAPYYIKYKYVLKIVLLVTAFGLTLGGLIDIFTETEIAWYIVFTRWIGTLFTGLVMAFGFVTFIFALFERKGIRLDAMDGLEDLPTVPQKQERIPFWDPLAGILVSVIFAVIFLACPQIMGGYFGDGDRQWIAFFNTGAIRSMWYIIIAFAVLGIGREVYKLYEGRYTKRLAILTVITDSMTIVFTFLFFGNKELVNTQFISEMQNLFTGDAEFVSNIFANLSLFFIGVITLALAIDMITTIVKAFKYDN